MQDHLTNTGKLASHTDRLGGSSRSKQTGLVVSSNAYVDPKATVAILNRHCP